MNYLNHTFTYTIAGRVVTSGQIKTWEPDGRTTFRVFESAYPDLWPVGSIGELYQVLFQRKDLITITSRIK
ncbi:hypothetical protein [Streptomyces sp. WZ-12]|uniref:hypothetical protein n=1 Tax=Streptomyces sp. WZ-12 TaxID=3030210 RepID=UPI002380FF30|nr:hypothetical protein [Streptomyces sp. WZ-12]